MMVRGWRGWAWPEKTQDDIDHPSEKTTRVRGKDHLNFEPQPVRMTEGKASWDR